MSNIQGGIDQIVTDSLVFYIDAANRKSYISGSGDDSGSTVYNLTNNLTGSVSSSVVYNTDNFGSFFLNSVGKIEVQNPYPVTYTDLTFGCWVFVSNLYDGGAPYGTNNDIVSKWDTSGNEKVFKLQVSGVSVSQGLVGVQISNDGSTETSFLSTERVNKGSWYYLVGYHDNVNQNLGVSVNGSAFEKTDYSNGVKVVGNQVKIGGIDAENSWRGNVACVQLYNKALTDAEVLQNYNALKHRFNL